MVIFCIISFCRFLDVRFVVRVAVVIGSNPYMINTTLGEVVSGEEGYCEGLLVKMATMSSVIQTTQVQLVLSRLFGCSV